MVESFVVTVTSRTEPKPPVGVIESLATGFETVASHIGLALFPALLDLLLWLGPKLSISPLTQSLINSVNSLSAPDETTAQGLQQLVDILRAAGERVNVFGFLSTAPLGVPSLMDGQPLDRIPGGQPAIVPIDNLLAFLTLALGFSLIGLLLGTMYFVLIAAIFDEEGRPDLGVLLKRILVNWARITALALLAATFSVAVGIMLVFLVSVAQVFLLVLSTFIPWLAGIGYLVGNLSLIILGAFMLWLLLYLAFSIHGMLLKNRGVLGSVWDSVRLVQWNLFSVMGLFLLIYVINFGLSYLWTLPALESWFTLAGIGGHAFVSTGLVTATFVFYKDRYRWWTEMRQWLLAEQRRYAKNRR